MHLKRGARASLPAMRAMPLSRLDRSVRKLQERELHVALRIGVGGAPAHHLHAGLRTVGLPRQAGQHFLLQPVAPAVSSSVLKYWRSRRASSSHTVMVRRECSLSGP